MVKIWPCYEGKIVTVGGPWKEISLMECQKTLDLLPSDYRFSLSEVLRFGNFDEDMTILGYKHVVVEVSEIEAQNGGNDWRPGKYLLRMNPDEVYNRLRLAFTSGSSQSSS
jgi:hypothetical protein